VTQGVPARGQTPRKFTAITNPQVARDVAQRLLQRGAAVRNVFTFRLGWRFMRLEPMDVVTLTDSVLGLQQFPVRITEVAETEAGTLQITAEDLPIGVHSTASYISQDGQAGGVDFGIAPGPVRDALVFEPIAPLVTQPELWVAGWGPAQQWGGAAVFLAESVDGPYIAAGSLRGSATMGELLDLLDERPTPDRTSVARLRLYAGALIPGDQSDARLLRRLLYIGHGNTYELVSHSAAEFLGSVGADGSTWRLSTYLERGVSGTQPLRHTVGTRVVRLDDGVLRVPIDPRLIGRQVWLKLVPYNVFGAEVLGVEDVTPVAHYVEGRFLLSPLPAITGLHATELDGYHQLGWDAVDSGGRGVPLTYEARFGETFSRASVLGTTTALHFTCRGAGTFWVTAYVEVATTAGARRVYAEAPASILFTEPTPQSDVRLEADLAAAGWPVTAEPFPVEIMDQGAEVYYRFLGAEPVHDFAGTVPQTAAGVIDPAAASVLTGGGYPRPYASWTPGEEPLGLRIDGTGKTRTPFSPLAPLAPLYYATPSWTLTFLFAPVDATTGRVLLDARSDYGLAGWRLLFITPGYVRLEDGLGNAWAADSTGIVMELGQYYDLAVRWVDAAPEDYPLAPATTASATLRRRSGTLSVYITGIPVLTVAVGPLDMASLPAFGWRVNPADPDASVPGGLCNLADVAWFRRALSEAELDRIYTMKGLTVRPPGLLVDRQAGRVIAEGLQPFDDSGLVDGEVTIDFAGGVAPGGRLYCDGAVAAQILSAPAQARPYTTAQVYALLPFTTVDDIGVVDDAPAIDGTDPTTVQAAAGLDLAPAFPASGDTDAAVTLADTPPYEGFRPYQPGIVQTQRARWRYDLTPREAGAVVCCDRIVVGLDPLPRSETGAGTPVGSGLDQLITSAALPTGRQAGNLVLEVPATIPAGATVCVAVAQRTWREPALTEPIQVQDDAGTYTAAYVSTSSLGAVRLAVFTRVLGAPLPAGARILVFNYADPFPTLAATAFSFIGLGALDAASPAAGYTATVPQLLPSTAPALGSAPKLLVTLWGVEGSLRYPVVPQTPGTVLLRAGSLVHAEDRLALWGLARIAPTTTPGDTAAVFYAPTVSRVYRSTTLAFGVAPATTTVRFRRPFNAPPSVQVTVVDAAAGDLAVVSNVTQTSFDVTVRNGGAAQARGINWTATGD
jgi:hypothetical protein